MFRCDLPQDRSTGPGFLFPGLARSPRSDALADRRAAAAAIFTDPRLGRLPRTLVNRVWQRLLGRGIVGTVDEMDGEPWSPALLDWLAGDFVAHGYDVKHLIETIVTSRAYQMPAVRREAEPPARGYVFRGPEVRRLTAEQFADAIGSITGEWSVAPVPGPPAAATSIPAPPQPSQPTTAGVQAREWRAPSTTLTRGLGRPIRDQITSIARRRRDDAAGARADQRRGALALAGARRAADARRAAGRPAEPLHADRRRPQRGAEPLRHRRHRRVAAVAGRRGHRLEPARARCCRRGPTPSWSARPARSPLSHADAGRRRRPARRHRPVRRAGHGSGGGIRVGNPSVVVYDIAGRGFTRFRGVIGIENPRTDIGATLNPALRFYVFDVAPNLRAPAAADAGRAAAAAPRRSPPSTPPSIASSGTPLGRPPTAGRAARRRGGAARDPAGGDRPSPKGLADLLWAVLMTPEFQIIE